MSGVQSVFLPLNFLFVWFFIWDRSYQEPQNEGSQIDAFLLFQNKKVEGWSK